MTYTQKKLFYELKLADTYTNQDIATGNIELIPFVEEEFLFKEEHGDEDKKLFNSLKNNYSHLIAGKLQGESLRFEPSIKKFNCNFELKEAHRLANEYDPGRWDPTYRLVYGHIKTEKAYSKPHTLVAGLFDPLTTILCEVLEVPLTLTLDKPLTTGTLYGLEYSTIYFSRHHESPRLTTYDEEQLTRRNAENIFISTTIEEFNMAYLLRHDAMHNKAVDIKLTPIDDKHEPNREENGQTRLF